MHPDYLKSLQTELGEVKLLQPLGKGKSAYSYLADMGGRQVVLKQMHDEPCSYYTFSENKVALEVRAYHRLTEIGMTLPRLLTFDERRGFLVKEFVDGVVADKWEPLPWELELAVEQLFEMSRRLRRHGLNIDYFPANFVIQRGRAQYIDYETNPYDEQWSLERWGIYYWANLDGMRSYSRSHVWHHINETEHGGVPIKAPFEAKVAAWCKKHGHSPSEA
jgi:TP53 regulating kinase and related kinases